MKSHRRARAALALAMSSAVLVAVIPAAAQPIPGPDPGRAPGTEQARDLQGPADEAEVTASPEDPAEPTEPAEAETPAAETLEADNATEAAPPVVDAPAVDAPETPAADAAESADDDADDSAAAPLNEVGDGRIVVSELTNGGPGGYHDNFIELANWTDEDQDVTGWEVFRCTGTGSRASAPQLTLEGTIEAGGTLLLGRSAGASTPEVPHPQSTIEADLLYHTSFANESYGAVILDADGNVVDAVGVKNPSVTGDACVSGTRLPNTTDAVAGESWQRIADTGDNAADFIRAPRTPGEENSTEPSPEPAGGDVLISEVAYAGPDGTDDALVEIGNYGDAEVSLAGYELWRCNEFGRRFSGDLIAADLPATIAAGQALVIDTAGFVDGAAGVVLIDGDGTLLDRVALADGADSACAQGQPLSYGALDVAAGESYQREAPEGDNRTAFVPAARTPGSLEVGDPIDGTEPEEEPLKSTGGPNLLFSELTNTGPGGGGDIFFELVNYGDQPQDLTGWSVWRCTGTGVRASVPSVGTDQFEGLELGAGQRVTAARIGQASPEVLAAADVFFDISFATQYGVILFDENMRVVDRLGSAPAGVENFCGQNYGALPGTLSGVHAETWQRIALPDTGADTQFIAAPRTPGAVNHQGDYTRPSVDSPVRITEVANGGPGGSGDNFMELTNLGEQPVDIGGWNFYRCTGSGRTDEGARQLTFPQVTLAPGQTYVAGRSGGFTGEADIEYGTSFASDGGFGVMITDADLRVVDSVGVYSGVDSPCTQGEALPNDLDRPAAESWQRVGDTGDNAADFERGARTPGEHGGPVTSVRFELLPPGDVQITELTNGGPADGEANIDDPGVGTEQFVELGNRGDAPVDVSGWQVQYCTPDGRREAAAQHTFPAGSSIAPGADWTLAGPDAPGALREAADAVADGPLDPAGYGVLVLDADGAIVDRVAVLYDYAGVVTNAPPSICGDGVALDRRGGAVSMVDGWAAGMSLHRWQYNEERDNYDDFVTGPATPGEFVQVEYHDPTVPVEGALDAPGTPRYDLPGAPQAASTQPSETSADLQVRAGAAGTLDVRGGQPASDEVWVFTGTAEVAPLPERTGADETPAQGTEVESAQYGRDYPYIRMEIEVGELTEQSEVVWSGSSAYRNELQLSLWDGQAWELVDARSATDGGDITLVGAVGATHVRDGVVDVLVQDGPRTTAAPVGYLSEEDRSIFRPGDPTPEPQAATSASAEVPEGPLAGTGLAAGTDQAFQDPGTYDFSLGHLTDTQYTADQAPWVFTAMNAWFAANQDERDLAFVMHTGDIIENALRGNQEPDRAIKEFERASAIQGILEDAEVPHGILPGNHDNWWGNNNDLYLEYFPQERFEDSEWYGGSGPLGATSQYNLVERDGVRMLFLSLPYYAAEVELEWASEVIASYPQHNVILATHEYLRPMPEVDERANAGNGRWAAQGDVFFDRLVEPHDNVVMVMGGHLHGVRQRVLTDVGGTPGRQVVETVADYQSYHDGDGFRTALFNRLYQVDVAAEQMALNAYSPVHDSFEPYRYEFRHPDAAGPDPEFDFTAEDDELILPIDLMSTRRVATDAVQVLTGVEEVASDLELDAGESATVTWDGLRDDTGYGWYATGTSTAMERVDVTRPSAVTAFVTGPTDPGPTDPGPTDPGPTDPGPTDPSPTDPGPTEPAPTSPSPTDPGPTEPAPTSPSPTDPGPTEPAPTQPSPTDPAPTAPGEKPGPGGEAGAPPGGDLPRTGAQVAVMIAIALALLLGGAGLFTAHRRRSTSGT